MSRYCIRLRSGSPHNCNGNVHGNVCGWFHSSWISNISTIYALFHSWHKTLLQGNAIASYKSRKAFLTVMTDESVQVWGRRNHVYNVYNSQPLRCPHNSLLLNPRDQWQQCTGSSLWPGTVGSKWWEMKHYCWWLLPRGQTTPATTLQLGTPRHGENIAIIMRPKLQLAPVSSGRGGK